ncbi:MAG: hypothetical protein WKG07_01235 [Hymenobacter sp.]
MCDGMGGYAKGNVASASPREITAGLVRLSAMPTLGETQHAVREALLGADRAIAAERAKAPTKETGSKMGTTASFVKMWHSRAGEHYAVVGHVGDNRVCCLRGGRKDALQHLTAR